MLIGFLLASASVAASNSPVLQVASTDGRRSVAAIQTEAPVTLDGALDEEAWRLAEPVADFVQAEPHEGQPATELTEVRLVFDRDALYVGVICHDASAAELSSTTSEKTSPPESRTASR